MTFALTATSTDHASQLNFEQIATVLSYFGRGFGPPTDVSGPNGRIYVREDGETGSAIYQLRAGAWAVVA